MRLPDCDGVDRLRWTEPAQTELTQHVEKGTREMRTRTRSRAAVAATAAMAALSLAGLTGCELLAGQVPLPTPDPTTTSTPAETDQERTIRLDKEAAEKAYTAAATEGNRLAMAGGVSKPTKVLTANLSGAYLDSQMAGLRFLKSRGFRTDRKTSDTVTANMGWSAKEIGLTACEDASEVRLLDKSGKEVMKDRNRRFVQTLTAKKVGGRWKITDTDSKVVESFRNEKGCSGP